MEDLIGRNVRGFKFESRGDLPYATEMNKYIGKVGEVIAYYRSSNEYRVKFEDALWSYPAEQIKKHLVEEWVIGQEYEFSEYGDAWYKRKLLAVLPENYMNRYIIEHHSFKNDWTFYNKIRPIKNNEVHQKIATLEKELAELKQLVK